MRNNEIIPELCANGTVIELQGIDDVTHVNESITEAHADPISKSDDTFPVISILKESSEGRKIVKSFMDRNEAYLEVDERKTLLRILVSHMCMLSGKEDLYPPSSLKEELAKAIVKAFPCLAVPCSDGSSLTNYTHYFNPKLTNGFIDTRLKTMRSKSEVSRKKKSLETKDCCCPAKRTKSNRRPDNELNGDRDPAFNEDEDIFKTHLPEQGSNENTIQEHMASTYNYRQHQISVGKWTTTQILAEYPRFRDCQNLIFRDFLLAFPKAGHFEETFILAQGPLVIKYALRSNVPVPDTEDVMRLIPSLKKIRVVSQDSIIERVVYFIKANEDILSIIEKKPHLKESPFMCCVGSLRNPICFSIVCEGELISSGTSSIKAFKNLFASFHMFRIKYPTLLSTFYYFFDSYVFNVHPGRIRPSVADFFTQLNA
ncbi:uncharacterized protein LOC130703022 isoform X2 [Daphnia carinata]|uniref:uncharacterized protein LOC130703022 isoform X2 n=1 Tax=Daphnia carinata TaxID=120202 RepID=UPI00257C85FC|nr:uncharacterized protein LOC130703022 isoform X2 [Daphnia carinata]